MDGHSESGRYSRDYYYCHHSSATPSEGGLEGKGREKRTLSSNTPISQNAHFLPNLVANSVYVFINVAPSVLFLRLESMDIVPR